MSTALLKPRPLRPLLDLDGRMQGCELVGGFSGRPRRATACRAGRVPHRVNALHIQCQRHVCLLQELRPKGMASAACLQFGPSLGGPAKLPVFGARPTRRQVCVCVMLQANVQSCWFCRYATSCWPHSAAVIQVGSRFFRLSSRGVVINECIFVKGPTVVAARA